MAPERKKDQEMQERYWPEQRGDGLRTRTESYSKPTQLAVTFGSGCIAGIVSALVSNPTDSLIWRLSKAENKGEDAGKIIFEMGLAAWATAGLGPRMLILGASRFCRVDPGVSMNSQGISDHGGTIVKARPITQ
ncbi:hypothetical protein K438DRAFT_1926701 [Mycena galopus ATCC 62051]|nr:hypothetical protein K438DRAFT_1926701 [Mycena galopus ATCC 62051]